MKFVPYKCFKDDLNSIDTFDILIMYLSDARHGGANYEEMGARIDLVKKLRGLAPNGAAPAPAGVTLDDDEYRLIKGILNYKFVWGANELVYEILTDIRDAKAPAAKAESVA